MEVKGQDGKMAVERTIHVVRMNLWFLCAIGIIMGFSKYADGLFQAEVGVILQCSVIVCAVIFNCVALHEPQSDPAVILNAAWERASLCATSAKDKVLTYFHCRMLKWSPEISVSSQDSAAQSQSSPTDTSSDNEICQESSNESLHTPEMSLTQKAARDIAKEKSQSEPPKKTISTFKATKGEKLNVKDNTLQATSPELFKNKVFQTRKILISSQEN